MKPTTSTQEGTLIASNEESRLRARSSMTEDTIGKIRRDRAFSQFRRDTQSEYETKQVEAQNIWKPSRFKLSFESDKLENAFQISRNELLVFECEMGACISLIFHTLIGTADILISVSAQSGLVQAILLCVALILVCLIQLCVVRAWAGKSVLCIKSFPSVQKAAQTKRGRIQYQCVLIFCLLLRLTINLIILAAAPGFNFSGRMLIVMAWMCLTTNLSALWWPSALLTVGIGTISFVVTLIYLWSNCVGALVDGSGSSIVLGFLIGMAVLVAIGNIELSFFSEILARQAFLHRESLRQSLYLFEYVVYSNLPEHVVNELNVRKKDLEDLQKNDSLNLSTTAIQMTQLSQMSMQPTSNLPHHRALLDQYDDVSIGFIYICGLEDRLKGTADDKSTVDTLQLLNRIWTRLDEITTKLNVWKVEHVLSEYLIAGGCPVAEPQHERKIANCLLVIGSELNRMNNEWDGETKLSFKMGMHIGSVVGAIIGNSVKRYSLFGDCMNYAARMKSTSLKNHIQVTSLTAQRLIQGDNTLKEQKEQKEYKKGDNDNLNSKLGPFHLERRGIIAVKGKGDVETFWLSTVGKLIAPKESMLTSKRRKSKIAIINSTGIRQRRSSHLGKIQLKKTLSRSSTNSTSFRREPSKGGLSVRSGSSSNHSNSNSSVGKHKRDRSNGSSNYKNHQKNKSMELGVMLQDAAELMNTTYELGESEGSGKGKGRSAKGGRTSPCLSKVVETNPLDKTNGIAVALSTRSDITNAASAASSGEVSVNILNKNNESTQDIQMIHASGDLSWSIEMKNSYLDHIGHSSLPSFRLILVIFSIIFIVIASFPTIVVSSASHELFTGCKLNISDLISTTSASELQPEPEAEPEAESEAEPEAEPGPEPESEPESEPEPPSSEPAGRRRTAEPAPESEPEPEPEPEPTEPIPNGKSEPSAEPETSADPEPEPGALSESACMVLSGIANKSITSIIRIAFIINAIFAVTATSLTFLLSNEYWHYRRTQEIAGSFVLLVGITMNVTVLWVWNSSQVNILAAFILLFAFFVLSTGFALSMSYYTSLYSLVPNTLFMSVMTCVVFIGTEGVQEDLSGMTFGMWLVVIRFVSVVVSATCLICLATSALETKNMLQFEDLVLIEELESSAEDLLCSILPRTANKGLVTLLALDGVGGTPKLEIEICPETTVIESDLVGSTALAATLEPLDVCIMLHDLYTRWDALTTIDGIVKITTIGDAYLAVAGPHFDENNGTKETGALAAVRMACSMLEEASKVKAVKHNIKDGEQEGEAKSIAIRIGVATGRIYGAVLGTRQFQWQIWGPALSDATRYEETGIPGQVHISKTTCVYAREAIQQSVQKKERRDLKFILEETDEEQKEKDDEYSQGYYVEYC